MRTQLHPHQGPQPPPNLGPCVLWPNGWMDQDATWYERRIWPWPHCVTWGPSSPFRKGAQPPPNFRAVSIVAKWSPISATAEYLFIIYTLCLKKFPPLNCLKLCQILTNFQHFCTAGKRMKFATKPIWRYSPQLRHVAAWEIKIWVFWRPVFRVDASSA